MSLSPAYELVIGLEVHAQLLTNSKLFCGDSIAYGADANTQVSPVTLAHPGTLPVMNRQAVIGAIRMGLACHAEIEKNNYFARKNYFYPDLPKGYQVSQHTTPICKGGYVHIRTAEGERNIQLNRIHLEEDAGKSIHDIDDDNTCIDYNRAGTALIEIVTEPDLHTADEVAAYLTELRKILRYLDVCDGNMEEGSMRCDVNISARLVGSTKLGTKVEIKNLNSIRNARKAVESEGARLIAMLEKGETIVQQTRGFDVASNTTFSIRDKEDADDYRYFADPDLPPFALEDAFINDIKASLPPLQAERIERYKNEFSLSDYDASVLTEEKEISDFYESLVATPALNKKYKAAANWMLGPVKSWLNENGQGMDSFPLTPDKLSAIISLVESGQLSFSTASTLLWQAMLKNPNAEPLQTAQQLNLLQQSGKSELEPLIDEVLVKFADKVKEYRKGKKGVLSLFVGEVMKRSKGKADPRVTNELLLEKLKEN
ncbi:MAG: Asp-tRNA(Asn)/Glu-tRNA(Gln) amidotransferase subunit GatB [Chitinophagaceae bacterium]|nr:Asp-tRNA(Asn)/Glu-tRNA(Gln) amidotransferase subunit GatB [Chitinophagaceae bacterium]